MIMIRAIQMILHLPIFNVVVPSNVMMVITKIISFVMFDFIENPFGYDLSLVYKPMELKNHRVITGQIEELGYESTNFIMNL